VACPVLHRIAFPVVSEWYQPTSHRVASVASSLGHLVARYPIASLLVVAYQIGWTSILHALFSEDSVEGSNVWISWSAPQMP
jgi:hypothetical protein